MPHGTPQFLRRLLPGAPARGSSRRLASAFRFIASEILTDPRDQERLARSNTQYADSGLADYLFAASGQPCDPDTVFPRLRWGGQLVYVSPHARQVEHLLSRYRAHEGFHVPPEVRALTRPRLGVSWNPFRQSMYCFLARRVALDTPGTITDRYSYDVRLVPSPGKRDEFLVLKQVPSLTNTEHRLSARMHGSKAQVISRTARKLVEKVFPLFLTREVAFLKILQRDLPDPYWNRVPGVVKLETDDQGFVQKIYLNWLRLGGAPLGQLEFAQQAMKLLDVLHEHVGVIHLDLRLDNFVVTEKGVGFVDFGSAARTGEDLARNPLLKSLFTEMMSTSQIQQDLRRLRDSGRVTSKLFVNSYQRIDKALDLFYLVLQMNNPHMNPDFRGLVRYEPESEVARRLAGLTKRVFQPSDPGAPPYRSARDVLGGLDQIHRDLGG